MPWQRKVQMGRAIIEHIGFFCNQRRNRGMPDKCSFQNRDSEHKTAQMHARTVLLDFYNQPAYHQWLWEETFAGTASQVSDDHFFICILLLACSSGAAICQSAVVLQPGAIFYSRMKWKELEGSGSKRRACLPFPSLCQWALTLIHQVSDICV